MAYIYNQKKRLFHSIQISFKQNSDRSFSNPGNQEFEN